MANKLPALVKNLLPGARPRSSAECAAEMERLTYERERAVAERERMGSERRALLVDTTRTDEEIARHDGEMARLGIVADRAEAQLERVEAERVEAVAREEAERRAELYRAGQTAERTRRKLLEEDYQRTAEKLADIARQAGNLAETIALANHNLPVGAAHLSLGENFNGTEARPWITRPAPPERWLCTSSGEKITRFWSAEDAARPGRIVREFPPAVATIETPNVQGVAHRPVLTDLRLPSIHPNTPDLWHVPVAED